MSELKFTHTPEWLVKQYVEMGKTHAEIAREAGVDESVICRRLQRCGIKGRRCQHQSAEIRAKISTANRGRKKTEEHKEKLRGPNHYLWKGGRKLTAHGYVYALCRNHPAATETGYVLEHRLVMEKRLGRLLRPEEVVHHINGDKKDNRDENLMLFASDKKHREYHRNLRRMLAPEEPK